MESRVSRLHDGPRIGNPGNPTLSFSLELKTALVFAALVAVSGVLTALLLFTDVVAGDTDLALLLGFTPGIIITGALASSFTFLVLLRNRLLLLAPALAFIAAGALMLGLDPLESLAKTLCAVCIGLWIAQMLTSISQVLLISVLIVVVDIYSVFFGPTKKMVESSSPLIDYLTISMPVFGVDAVSRLGASDIIFFSLFIVTTLFYGLRRTLTAVAMTLSIVGTMVIGVTLGYGVPALPFLSISFLLANADLLYRRFLDEPDEIKRREEYGPPNNKNST
jgi:hypothetical protein